jgi:hypothetical protein
MDVAQIWSERPVRLIMADSNVKAHVRRFDSFGNMESDVSAYNNRRRVALSNRG